jgi:hypothetical protein
MFRIIFFQNEVRYSLILSSSQGYGDDGCWRSDERYRLKEVAEEEEEEEEGLNREISPWKGRHISGSVVH